MDKKMKIWNIKEEKKHTSTDFGSWLGSLNLFSNDKKEKFVAVGSWDEAKILYQKDYKIQKEFGKFDSTIVSLVTDDDGEFLLVGEKKGRITIWNIDDCNLRKTIEIGYPLNCLSYNNKYFMVITVATEKGLLVKPLDIHDNNIADVLLFQPKINISCLSLAWDLHSRFNTIYNVLIY